MHLREVADKPIPYQANTEVSLLIGTNALGLSALEWYTPEVKMNPMLRRRCLDGES